MIKYERGPISVWITIHLFCISMFKFVKPLRDLFCSSLSIVFILLQTDLMQHCPLNVLFSEDIHKENRGDLYYGGKTTQRASYPSSNGVSHRVERLGKRAPSSKELDSWKDNIHRVHTDPRFRSSRRPHSPGLRTTNDVEKIEKQMPLDLQEEFLFPMRWTRLTSDHRFPA